MSCAKASTFNSGKTIHLQYGALFFGIFLKKQWKRAGVSKPLAFQVFVLLSGVQRDFSRPFFLLILKKVNYDLRASSASWHLRLGHCRRRVLSTLHCKD